MKKFISMTLILCMVLSLISFGTITASAEEGIVNYTVYNTFDESSADGLYDGLFTAGYNYLTDQLLMGSVNGAARWGHTVSTVGKSVMQQHISIAGKTAPVIVEYTALLKGGSKYYCPQYGGHAGGTGSSSYNGFDSKTLSTSALSIDAKAGATKFTFVIDPVGCKITPYKNGEVVESAVVTLDAGQTDVYLGHCFDTAYSANADKTDPAKLEKYLDLYYMMVYDEGETPDFEVKSYTTKEATVQFNTPVSLDVVAAMTANGVQVTGAEDVSAKNEQANLYKVTYGSLSGGTHTFALSGTSLSGRVIDAKKEFSLVSVVNPEATEKNYVDVQFGCAVTDITAVGTNILPLGDGEKYEEEIENCYRIKLTGLDYEQSYEFTVSAESAAYGTITQTLTAKVRAPKAYANVLGVYKDGYSNSEETIDPLVNAKLTAAVAIANETATPYEFKVVFAIINPDGEVVGYGESTPKLCTPPTVTDNVITEADGEIIVEANIDATLIEGIKDCTYKILLWDNIENMLPYGAKMNIADGIKVSDKVNEDDELVISIDGYSAAYANEALNVLVKADGKEYYINDGVLSDSVVIPLSKTAQYSVKVNSTAFKTAYTDTISFITDEYYNETILADIEKAQSKDDINAILTTTHKVADAVDFDVYNSLAPDEKAEVAAMLYNRYTASETNPFATKQDFYKEFKQASVIVAVKSADASAAEIATILEDNADLMGFAEYKAYDSFAKGDATFKAAVAESIKNYTVTDRASLSCALSGSVVTTLIDDAKHYTYMYSYIEDNNDLLGLDLTKYEKCKEDVATELVGDPFASIYGEFGFIKAFNDAVTKYSSKPSIPSGGGGGGGGGGGKDLYVDIKPSDDTEEETTTANNPVQKEENVSKAPFNDLDGHSWAVTYIEDLYVKGIISGKGNGSFAPADNVTRAEMIKLIVSACDITGGTNTAEFTDVSEADWYYTYVQNAVSAGIISGYGNGLFGSNDYITRQDAAVIACKALGLEGGELANSFVDGSSIADYAVSAVNALVEKGVLSGNDNGYFLPSDNLSRAEAAKIIYKLMQLNTK